MPSARFASPLLLLLFPAVAAPPPPEDPLPAAREAVASFQQKLQAELLAGLKSGGPPAAIEVCRTKAPEIAAATSHETGFRVGRTAAKLRNPANAPDGWERAALEELGARLANGEDPASLEKSEVVERDGKKVFRYARAIRTAEPCLSCHGAAVSPEVAGKLRELYPKDEATGFAAGSLRGIFTVTKPLS